MRTDLDEWARAIDARMAEGADAFTAVTETDPRDTLQGSVQLSMELRG